MRIGRECIRVHDPEKLAPSAMVESCHYRKVIKTNCLLRSVGQHRLSCRLQLLFEFNQLVTILLLCSKLFFSHVILSSILDKRQRSEPYAFTFSCLDPASARLLIVFISQFLVLSFNQCLQLIDRATGMMCST